MNIIHTYMYKMGSDISAQRRSMDQLDRQISQKDRGLDQDDKRIGIASATQVESVRANKERERVNNLNYEYNVGAGHNLKIADIKVRAAAIKASENALLHDININEQDRKFRLYELQSANDIAMKTLEFEKWKAANPFDKTQFSAFIGEKDMKVISSLGEEDFNMAMKRFSYGDPAIEKILKMRKSGDTKAAEAFVKDSKVSPALKPEKANDNATILEKVSNWKNYVPESFYRTDEAKKKLRGRGIIINKDIPTTLTDEFVEYASMSPEAQNRYAMNVFTPSQQNKTMIKFNEIDKNTLPSKREAEKKAYLQGEFAKREHKGSGLVESIVNWSDTNQEVISELDNSIDVLYNAFTYKAPVYDPNARYKSYAEGEDLGKNYDTQIEKDKELYKTELDKAGAATKGAAEKAFKGKMKLLNGKMGLNSNTFLNSVFEFDKVIDLKER